MIAQIKNISLFVLLFSSFSVYSNTVQQAIQSEKNNEDTEANQIWSKLAASGNAIAKYNLAKQYQLGKGVAGDPAQAKKWFQQASQSGLAQAYVKLNSNAIKPGVGVHLTFKSGPLYWLKDQDPKLYTLQLASSRREKSIIKLYEENLMQNKGGYFKYESDGIERYALIYGAYETVAEAKDSIKDLPEGLRNRTPWVRNIERLQKLSK